MFEKYEITVDTASEGLEKVTEEIDERVDKSGMGEGICTVFSRHTTAGIIVNEDEKGLRQDVLDSFRSMVPEDKSYRHNRGHDGNATSHIKNVLTGPGKTIPFENGKLDLGTWQEVFLVETDGPRKRTIVIALIN